MDLQFPGFGVSGVCVCVCVRVWLLRALGKRVPRDVGVLLLLSEGWAFGVDKSIIWGLGRRVRLGEGV